VVDDTCHWPIIAGEPGALPYTMWAKVREFPRVKSIIGYISYSCDWRLFGKLSVNRSRDMPQTR